QAAIADLHLREPRDWEEIELLYQRLEHITSSPVVTMNRAIAVAELKGPQAALALLEHLKLDDYRYYHSTRADLLRRLGRHDAAPPPTPRPAPPCPRGWSHPSRAPRGVFPTAPSPTSRRARKRPRTVESTRPYAGLRTAASARMSGTPQARCLVSIFTLGWQR